MQYIIFPASELTQGLMMARN